MWLSSKSNQELKKYSGDRRRSRNALDLADRVQPSQPLQRFVSALRQASDDSSVWPLESGVHLVALHAIRQVYVDMDPPISSHLVVGETDGSAVAEADPRPYNDTRG